VLTYLPVFVAVAAIALTYLFCIRPMRRGNACFHGPANTHNEQSQELERARTELELLRLRERQRAESPG
jgi:hypothetical protein